MNKYEATEEQIKKYFDFYQQKVLPVINKTKSVTQQEYWYHWLYTHTEWVVFRWIFYSLSMNKNPIPVIFACAGHDLARRHDWEDIYHWPNAVPIISEIMEHFNDILTDKEKDMVREAIKNHTIWKIAPDYVSACLWDADRTRLSREGIFLEKCYNTEIWKKVASWSAVEFIVFENKCLWRDKYTDNENVLNLDLE